MNPLRIMVAPILSQLFEISIYRNNVTLGASRERLKEPIAISSNTQTDYESPHVVLLERSRRKLNRELYDEKT